MDLLHSEGVTFLLVDVIICHLQGSIALHLVWLGSGIYGRKVCVPSNIV